MTEEKLRKACELKRKIDELQEFLDECSPNMGLHVMNRKGVQYLHGECKAFVLGYLRNNLDTLKKEFEEL